MDPVLITQIISAALGALVSGLGVHLFHTSSNSKIPLALPVDESKLPIPVPVNPVPGHPLVSKVLHELGVIGEEAAANAIRARLGVLSQADPAAVASTPATPAK